MPECCIDANIAVKWFIKGEVFRRKALKTLRESQAAGITLIAPPLFEMETDSVIQTRVVDGRTTPAVADKTLALLDTAPVVTVTDPRLRQQGSGDCSPIPSAQSLRCDVCGSGRVAWLRVLDSGQGVL